MQAYTFDWFLEDIRLCSVGYIVPMLYFLILCPEQNLGVDEESCINHGHPRSMHP